MNHHCHPRSAITLIQVIVCLVLTLVVIWIMVPIVIQHLMKGHGHPRRYDMSSMYKQVFAAATENTGDRVNYWAASEPDTKYANYKPTSTDYFRWLMTPFDVNDPAKGAGVLQQDFFPFQGPGLKAISRLEDLTADSNPWVVVADLSETSASGTPFMISRNVNEMQLSEWSQPQPPLMNVGTGTYSTPHGEEALMVVRVGGGSDVLKPKQFFWDILNPTSATNRVLQP